MLLISVWSMAPLHSLLIHYNTLVQKSEGEVISKLLYGHKTGNISYKFKSIGILIQSKILLILCQDQRYYHPIDRKIISSNNITSTWEWIAGF